MPVPPAPTALALLSVLLLIAAAELARARRTRHDPDVYEPGDQLSPAEAADIEDVGFEPVYLPDRPGTDKARTAEALQTEALAAEAQLAARSQALDEQWAQLARIDRQLDTDSPPNPPRAPRPVPATSSLASPRKEPTAP
ncbi:hypothetical protein ABT093_36880 [Kitasatospora sp. NPDC002551]|uniref:hypothetical protein n=1 Tax=Kitasatospora sp. NPDC002551 TaxID=3154539 RepID=UPI00332746C7